MKKSFSSFVLFLLIFFVFTSLVFPQTHIKKNPRGDYAEVTVFNGVDVATGDTSEVFKLPYDVTRGIFYIETTTVTTSDTLKSMVIQESADGTLWVNSGLSFSNVTTAGIVRKATTEVSNYFIGRYIRFVFAVGGAAAAIDFKLKFVPKL